MSFIDYFQQNFIPKVNKNVNIKFRKEISGDKGYDNNLGSLYGVELESDNYSGYIYFWDKGFLDFSVICLEPYEELLPVQMIEVDSYTNQAGYVNEVIRYFM
ncbi:hypothetical protein BKI52_37410 [marine bacterium AO1-C]|nr:hypothetical protein BKI52_37410 [marine bacterium AO1-C]